MLAASFDIGAWTPSIIAAAFVFAGVLVTQWQLNSASRRTTRLESDKVDAAAYERARQFDKEVVEGIRQELRDARNEITELRATLSRERLEHEEDNRKWRRKTYDMQRHIDRLEEIIRRLTDKLRDAGIDLGEDEQYQPYGKTGG